MVLPLSFFFKNKNPYPAAVAFNRFINSYGIEIVRCKISNDLISSVDFCLMAFINLPDFLPTGS
jgi:hypothetical protein